MSSLEGELFPGPSVQTDQEIIGMHVSVSVPILSAVTIACADFLKNHFSTTFRATRDLYNY
jgi:hypothetical protein